VLYSAALQGGVENKKRYKMLDACENTAVLFMTSGLLHIQSLCLPVTFLRSRAYASEAENKSVATI